jgi:hypothetical protein
MKTQCLLKQNRFHTTAWISAEAPKLGLLVEIPELGGRWEIVEIYPYRLSDKQLKTHNTLIVPFQVGIGPASAGKGVARV